MVTGEGSTTETLSDERVQELLAQALEPMALDGQRVLVIIPDGTRAARLYREHLVDGGAARHDARGRLRYREGWRRERHPLAGGGVGPLLRKPSAGQRDRPRLFHRRAKPCAPAE